MMWSTISLTDSSIYFYNTYTYKKQVYMYETDSLFTNVVNDFT